MTPTVIYKHKLKWSIIQKASGSSSSPTPQRELVAKPGITVLIILSLVCESAVKDIGGHLSNPFSKRNSVDRNIIGMGINGETESHTSIISY